MADDWKAIKLKEKRDRMDEKEEIRKKLQPTLVDKGTPGGKAPRYIPSVTPQERAKLVARDKAIDLEIVEIDKDLGIIKKPGDKTGF